jgi:hypothetical protein
MYHIIYNPNAEPSQGRLRVQISHPDNQVIISFKEMCHGTSRIANALNFFVVLCVGQMSEIPTDLRGTFDNAGLLLTITADSVHRPDYGYSSFTVDNGTIHILGSWKGDSQGDGVLSKVPEGIQEVNPQGQVTLWLRTGAAPVPEPIPEITPEPTPVPGSSDISALRDQIQGLTTQLAEHGTTLEGLTGTDQRHDAELSEARNASASADEKQDEDIAGVKESLDAAVRTRVEADQGHDATLAALTASVDQLKANVSALANSVEQSKTNTTALKADIAALAAAAHADVPASLTPTSLAGYWSGAGATLYFNTNGTGSLIHPNIKQAYFKWVLASDNVTLTYLTAQEAQQSGYTVNMSYYVAPPADKVKNVSASTFSVPWGRRFLRLTGNVGSIPYTEPQQTKRLTVTDTLWPAGTQGVDTSIRSYYQYT